MNNNILYIGLNGYAGSGKDTVAKMIYCILNENFTSKEKAFEKFKTKYATNIKRYATLDESGEKYVNDKRCICIAFADQLKEICSVIFGIPLSYFYYKKENAWICINKDFEYTEEKPDEQDIITAEDYYIATESYKNSDKKYYMNLREILVYVGTYICQDSINLNVFVNCLNNKVNRKIDENKNIKYVICTDVRFMHEFSFIKENNGVMINIVRDNIDVLDNVAEHELDMLDDLSYNYTIYNNGTYEELFDNVWELIKENKEFQNKQVQLISRDRNIESYLRFVTSNDNISIYRFCSNSGMLRILHNAGSIVAIDPQGGPYLSIGTKINGIQGEISKIEFDDEKSEYYIEFEKD